MKAAIPIFKRLRVVFFLSFVVLVSCNTNSREKLLKNIRHAEAEMNVAKAFDRQKGSEIIETYVVFAETFPDDTLSASFLFKAGEISMNLQFSEQAIAYFSKVRADYPFFYKAPECLFLKAFVFENQLNNIKEAEIYYKEFIASYPNHPLTDDAVASLEYLGKSPEELVRMFQEKNAELQ
ncbi:MAG: tol-pal system YbgF family protein [Salinivirgaceae bacterium]